MTTLSASKANAQRVRMAAMRLTAPRRFEMVDVDRPEPAAGEVLIEVRGCGVCASNVPPWEGREWFTYPMAPGALGHEAWGVVAECGDGVGLERGSPVATLSDHAFAEYVCVGADRCVQLPDSFGDRPFPGEPLACAVNIARRAMMGEGETIAIIGAGFLGNLLIQIGDAAGARMVALSRRLSSLDMAAESGTWLTVPLDDDRRAIELAIQKGGLCDCVIECTGTQAGLDIASELVRVRGRLVIAGYHQDGPRTVNMQQWNWRGIDVINAHERDEEIYIDGMRRAIAAVQRGALKVEPLLTHHFELADLNDALRAAATRPEGFVKAFVTT